jgi:cysteinyl-tRNA synthetase
MKLYNTLTKKIEEFKPLKPDFVRLYDCGPTVYFYAQIGNMWRYLISDFLRRTLEYNGYQVKQVMNITDVGHLTEDDLLAADTGEDKMEVAAKKEKKTPKEIADFYTAAFFKDRERLNMLKPHLTPKATEHIEAMIKLIKILEEKGYAYWAGEKYFVYDISKFKDYGKLSGKKIEELKSGARLEPVPGKKNPFDFALWIKDPKHLMHWDSPWGVGYPGWHIECSAMAMEYLGPTLDIHTGGEDNIFPHHENEIAQSEAATGKPFSRFWLHIRHNLVDGQKMSKSKGNFYLLQDLVDKGFDPLAYRYLCLTAHYRKNLNFTWEGLKSAAISLNKLRELVASWRNEKGRKTLTEEDERKVAQYKEEFLAAINQDLNFPQALAVAWQLAKSSVSSQEKLDLILDFDQVLGLKLSEVKAGSQLEYAAPKSGINIYSNFSLSPATVSRIDTREIARQGDDFSTADEIRKEIEKTEKVKIKDTPAGTVVKKQ